MLAVVNVANPSQIHQLDKRRILVIFRMAFLTFIMTGWLRFGVSLYSGHAGRDSLELEDGKAHVEGIAALLGRCENLKLVILNGCSTAGQVNELLKQNIPIVIATSAPVEDRRATEFSISFFEQLAIKRHSIRAAFNEAIDTAKVRGPIKPEICARGKLSIPDEEHRESLWGLYYQDENEELLDSWRLPEKPTQNEDNTLHGLVKQLYNEYSIKSKKT